MADAWTDALGQAHARADGAPRIACLVPSITELVCGLGLADRLIARTGFCIHPRDLLADVPKVGGTKDVNLRKLQRLAPTHAIVNIDENLRETAEALRAFVPHLIVTHPGSPEDNRDLYRLLGGIFGREAEAEALCARLDVALIHAREATAHLPRERVLYLIWRDPWMSVARDTYIARTLATVGWDTLPEAAPARYPEVDVEAIGRHADRVLLSTEPYRFDAPHVADLREHLGGIPVHLIDGEMTSWYGPRAIAGLDYLAALRRSLNG
jgi:ABC-type Fe3+-hydroxamate transport system substrate-binding protein